MNPNVTFISRSVERTGHRSYPVSSPPFPLFPKPTSLPLTGHSRFADSSRCKGVREFETLEPTVFGRARLPPSRALVRRIRLSRTFALPIPGHPHLPICRDYQSPTSTGAPTSISLAEAVDSYGCTHPKRVRIGLVATLAEPSCPDLPQKGSACTTALVNRSAICARR